ncbi:MAG: 5-formyltetrahydrofolate cyclo-ligase [Desulfofustis sp.]|nr:5-formyltetrahydrofolate cyclo-ligase [Desulfofustis sp.]
MNQPNNLRALTLAQRDRLTDQQRHKKSERIAATLLASEAVLSSFSIFIYVNFRSEVETVSLIRSFLKMGKQVSVPLTRVAEKRLDIVLLKDLDRDLAPGYCAIPEPTEEVAEARTISAEELDLILLPGSVFDERGGRFGYGGGYYDRLLASIPGATRYGLAYELQVVKQLDLQPHDQILDGIVTEERLITFPKPPLEQL